MEQLKPRKVPETLILKAFKPTPESAKADELQYSSNMEDQAGKVLYESQLTQSMREHDQRSLEYQSAKRELDKSVMVLIAFRMNSDNTNQGDKARWAQSFTEKSIETYGEPNRELASELLTRQFSELLLLAKESDVDEDLISAYESLANKLGVQVERSLGQEESREKELFPVAAEKVGDYLREQYADVFEAMAIDKHRGRLTPGDVADYFEIGRAKLAEKDSSWDDWTIERDDKGDTLSVKRITKEITVGMLRKTASADEIEGLFSHEILRHALTAINGDKLDDKLGKGLPDYLDFEEGAGVLNEYAITGKIPEKIVDRYVDIALALGIANDGKPIPREQLLQFTMIREHLRNATRSKNDKLSNDDVTSGVFAHVNRIYRGTPGDNKTIGVFTKDIAYMNGFLAAGEYVESRLMRGDDIVEIMEYLMLGKFDPTNPVHEAYILEARREDSSRTDLVRFTDDI